jgi:hypothetical protein
MRGKYENGSSRVGWGDVDWIHLAPDRDIWRAIVNAVMNLRFHKVGLIS